jgi:hypothetical protein
MADLENLSRTKLVEIAERATDAADRNQARARLRSIRNQEIQGVVVGALVSGFVGANGKNIVPENLPFLPVDTEIVAGGAALAYAWNKNTSTANRLRGAGYAWIVGALKDYGAAAAKMF